MWLVRKNVLTGLGTWLYSLKKSPAPVPVNSRTSSDLFDLNPRARQADAGAPQGDLRVSPETMVPPNGKETTRRFLSFDRVSVGTRSFFAFELELRKVIEER